MIEKVSKHLQLFHPKSLEFHLMWSDRQQILVLVEILCIHFVMNTVIKINRAGFSWNVMPNVSTFKNKGQTSTLFNASGYRF